MRSLGRAGELVSIHGCIGGGEELFGCDGGVVAGGEADAGGHSQRDGRARGSGCVSVSDARDGSGSAVWEWAAVAGVDEGFVEAMTRWSWSVSLNVCCPLS